MRKTGSSSDKIEVVHLVGQLGRGGTERQLCLLLCHSDRQRFHHRVVVFNPSHHAPWNEELEAAGVELLEIPTQCRGSARRLVYLLRQLRRRRPHVIHSWTVHDNPYAGVLGFLLRIPVRWGSLRGTWHTEGIRRLPTIYRYLMRRSVQRMVVNCRALANQLVADGYPEDRVFILPNCVPTAESSAQASSRAADDLASLATEGPLVGIVANLRECKNPLMFVRAMGQVLPQHPTARALLVGQSIPTEPEMPRLIEAEIRRQGLHGRVIITGFRDDVPAILQHLSIFCLTSNSEGMPNAVLEAMIAGLPVVATRVGGVPELVVDGCNGHIVEPGDADALGQAVHGLLADSERASEMGKNGRRRAMSDHDCQQTATRLEELYEEALRANSPADAGPESSNRRPRAASRNKL